MKSNWVDGIGLRLAICALVPAYLRWFRVAQREHYLPGSTARFARRWWGSGPLNQRSGLSVSRGAVASVWFSPAGLCRGGGGGSARWA